MAGLAAVYAAAGRFGLQLDAVSGFATLVWPPSGISLAALLLPGSRVWPGVTLGAFIVKAWTGALVNSRPAPMQRMRSGAVASSTGRRRSC